MTVYYDMAENIVCSRILSDFATPEEIDAVRQALKDRWRALGREMQGADVRRQDNCRQQRHMIRKVLREITADAVPMRYLTCAIGDKPPLLTAIEERYEVAYREAEEVYAAEIAATPVDDAAWHAELERRARVEAWERARGQPA